MKFFAAAALVVVMAGAQNALAQPPSNAPPVQNAPSPSLEAEPMPPLTKQDIIQPDPNAPLNLDDLSNLRGGETYTAQLSNQNLNAVNSGNSVTGEMVGSGAVNLNSNAFTGYEGIGNFVINTGHNNNLMGSISVNVLVTPQ